MPKKKTAARTATVEAEAVGPPVDTSAPPLAAEAVVDAVITSGGPMLARAVETAMAQAVLDIQKESEAIAAETGDEEDKRLRILALNDPIAVRARMLEYRVKALAEAGASAT